MGISVRNFILVSFLAFLTEECTFMLISSSTFIVRALDNTNATIAFVQPNASGVCKEKC